MRKELFRNSASGVIRTLVRILLAIVTIPLFIQKLGTEGFGIFALVSVMGNLQSLSNVGITYSLVKFLAEQGKSDESNRDILVAGIILICLLVPVIALGFIFKHVILIGILNVPQGLIGQASCLYDFFLLANAPLLLGQIFTSMLDAQQKVHLSNLLQIIYSILYWTFILVAIFAGAGLDGVGGALLLNSLLWFFLSLLTAWHIWGKPSVSRFRANFGHHVKKQFSYGLKMYTSGILSLFFEPVTKIMVSHFVGVADVGFYDIAVRIKNYIGGVLSSGLYPLYPMIANLRDKVKIRLLVHDIEQKSFLLVLPMIVFAILAVKPFIGLWIGRNVNSISNSTVIILVSYLVSSTSIPLHQFLLSKNLASKMVVLWLLNVLINVIIFLATFRFFGFYAAALGNAAAMLLSFVGSLYYQRKYLDSVVFDSLKQLGALLLVFGITSGTGYLATAAVSVDLLKILVSLAAVTLVPLACYRWLRVIRPEDIRRYAGENGRLASIGMKILCRV